VILLVFANKQDLPNALSVSQVVVELGIGLLRGIDWHIEACCATSGEGLYEGFEWLASTVKRRYG
jgi:ADP-ribosylation factor protein 1